MGWDAKPAAIDFAAIGFAGGELDRAENRRTDPGWVAEQLAQADSRVCVIVGEEIAVIDEPDTAGAALVWIRGHELATAGLSQDDAVLLGIDASGAAQFGVELDPEGLQRLSGKPGIAAQAVPLRGLAVEGRVPPGELALVAHAKSMLNWHGSHGFCARCGTATTSKDAGAKRNCPACGREHFPRVDPVAIMLVHDGANCVLARQSRFPPGMYSALAGFVEPGENAEDAVRREVLEEAGIRVGEVRYLASQPWPFPSSLMIGCHAQALSHEFDPDWDELEDVRWFSRAEAADIINGIHADGIAAPPRFAIAHHLIKAFVEQD